MEHPLGLLHPHLAFIQHCPILTTTLLFGVYQLILSLESNGTSLTTTPSPRCSPHTPFGTVSGSYFALDSASSYVYYCHAVVV